MLLLGEIKALAELSAQMHAIYRTDLSDNLTQKRMRDGSNLAAEHLQGGRIVAGQLLTPG